MKSHRTISFHYGYIIVGCCFLIMFVIVGLVMNCAGIFYKPISEELGVDVGKFGLYMSLNFLFSTLTLSFAGKLLEKYSAHIILTLCSAMIAATFMMMSLFGAVWQFYVAGAVFGIMLAFLLYLGLPTLLNRWFKTRMGVFIGICSAGSGIGGVLFNPLAGFLITEYDWRMTYLIFGIIIMLIVTPILGLFLRDYPEDKELKPYGETELSDTVSSQSGGKQSTGNGIEYAYTVRMPIFYGLIVFAFLMNATATLNVFIPTYMQEILFSVEQASFVASAVMVGVTIGKILLGMINDRSTLYGILTTIGLGISGLVLLLMAQAGIILSIIGGFLFGWAYAGVSVQTPMLVRFVFGNKNYARIYSIVSMAIAIGGAIAAGGWGLLADATSYGFIFIVGIVFLVLSGGIGLSALHICRKNRRRQVI